MKNKIILISATVFFLSGCTAVKHQTMKSEADGTVLAVLDEFVKDTQAGLFDPYNIYDISGINPGLTTWDKKYPALQKWWCIYDYHEKSVKLKKLLRVTVLKITEYMKTAGAVLIANLYLWLKQVQVN